MPVVIIALGLLFVVIGFIINEKNAKNWLSGYNTLSPEKQAEFPIARYIERFRKFHLFLGLTTIVGGLLFYYFVSKDWATILICIYPIAAYIYFVASADKSMDIPQSGSSKKLAIIVLGISIVGVTTLFFLGRNDNAIFINGNGIEIKGVYGSRLNFSEIDSVYVIAEVPPIQSRIHGFGLNEIKKGNFKLKDGRTVRLILNTMNSEVLCIQPKESLLVLYSHADLDEGELASRIEERMGR
jgi:hypothetical protein